MTPDYLIKHFIKGYENKSSNLNYSTEIHFNVNLILLPPWT